MVHPTFIFLSFWLSNYVISPLKGNAHIELTRIPRRKCAPIDWLHSSQIASMQVLHIYIYIYIATFSHHDDVDKMEESSFSTTTFRPLDIGAA